MQVSLPAAEAPSPQSVSSNAAFAFAFFSALFAFFFVFFSCFLIDAEVFGHFGSVQREGGTEYLGTVGLNREWTPWFYTFTTATA